MMNKWINENSCLCLWLSGFINPSIHSSIYPILTSQPSRRPFSYLSRRLDSLPNAEVDNGEDEEQAKGQLPADKAQLVQTWWEVNLQHLATAGRKQGGKCVWLDRCGPKGRREEIDRENRKIGENAHREMEKNGQGKKKGGG